MLSALKPISEKALTPVAKIFKNVNPSYITLAGMIFPVIFFVLLIKGQYVWALLTFILNAVDMLDGLVARTQNKVTAFGGFLDSTIDRFSDFVIIVAFAFANLVSWNIVAPLLLLTYLISYIRSRTELASKNTLVANVGIIERTERLVTIFIALLLHILFSKFMFLGYNILSIFFIVLTVLSLVTVAQRVVFAYKKL